VHRRRAGHGCLIRTRLTPRLISAAELLDELQPGRSVYIQGASGELRFLQALFSSASEKLAHVTLVSCLLPGINSFDYTALDSRARLETFLLPPPLRASFTEGRIQILPLAYSAIAAHLETRPIDVAFLHVTPPHNGRCSFGVTADFGAIVARSALRRIGILNRAMPRPLHSPTIALEHFDAIMEINEPLSPSSISAASSELRAIARHVADLVPNGATVQTGIGHAPTAIWEGLCGHKELRLWSGIVSDGFFTAMDAGSVLDSGHVAGIAHGTAKLYERLNLNPSVSFRDVQTTHDAATLGRIDRFVAINSALEVDLFGQVNLEWQGGRLISGTGGAPDFGQAARRSKGGRSIVAMPATARDGSISRICARLNAPTVSLGRTDSDVVVTEYGVASLAGLSIDARAAALIAIAAPPHRPVLASSWAELRRSM
jgi:acyl-CoA hydrolase